MAVADVKPIAQNMLRKHSILLAVIFIFFNQPVECSTVFFKIKRI
jgi:hypothetical protein